MAIFNILEFNKRVMDQVGIYFPSNDYRRSAVAYFILLNLFGAILIYAKKTYNVNDFSEKCVAFSVFIGMCQAFGIYLNIRLKRKNITDLHHELQSIVDKGSEDNYIRNMYWNTEQKCRKYTRIIAILSTIQDESLYIPPLFLSIYYICIGHFDTSTWLILIELSISFNSVYGWYLSWFVSVSISTSYMLSMIASSTYFMSCCFYITAICDHFNRLIQLTQMNVKQNQTEKNCQTRKMRCNEIAAQLCGAIEIHVKIQEVFDAIADINSGSIFSLLPVNAIPLGTIVYRMDQITTDFDMADMFAMIILFFIVLIWPFFFCTFANSATEHISLIRYTVYDLDWYDLPPKLQKYFILIIAQAEEPRYFTGFNLIHCTLFNFGKIIRSSFSYYLLFRNVSKILI